MKKILSKPPVTKQELKRVYNTKTLKKACEIYGITKTTLYNWLNKYEIPKASRGRPLLLTVDQRKANLKKLQKKSSEKLQEKFKLSVFKLSQEDIFKLKKIQEKTGLKYYEIFNKMYLSFDFKNPDNLVIIPTTDKYNKSVWITYELRQKIKQMSSKLHITMNDLVSMLIKAF